MQASRLLIFLLLAAAVLVDLVVLSVAAPTMNDIADWPHPLLVVLLSLAFSQVSMAAVWAGLSGISLPWRLVGPVAIVTLWSVALSWQTADAADRHHAKHMWGVLLMGHAFLILLILLDKRADGGRLANCLKTNAEPKVGRWQFSLGHLFAWLTAAAVSLGLLRYTIDFDLLTDIQSWADSLLLSPCNAVVTLATLWAVLSSKRLMWRVAGLCLATGAVLLLPLMSAPEYLLSWTVLWVLQIGWLSAWLFVLRTAGIRFVLRDTEGHSGRRGDVRVAK